MTSKFLLITILGLGTLEAGSLVDLPANTSISISAGAYFCADEITVAAEASFTAENPDDVCVAPTGSGDISLPVELAFFRAGLDPSRTSGSGSVVTLDWETESETENLGFIVERASRAAATEFVTPSTSTGSASEDDLNPEFIEGWLEIANYMTHHELEGQGSKIGKTVYSYIDDTIEPGSTYDYRLGDVSYAGKIVYHLQPVVGISVPFPLPDAHTLYQNFPNPFNPATTIRYTLAESDQVQIDIIDIRGKHVLSLVSEPKTAGYYQINWAGIDRSGEPVSAGVYLCLFRAGAVSRTIKLTYLR